METIKKICKEYIDAMAETIKSDEVLMFYCNNPLTIKTTKKESK